MYSAELRVARFCIAEVKSGTLSDFSKLTKSRPSACISEKRGHLLCMFHLFAVTSLIRLFSTILEKLFLVGRFGKKNMILNPHNIPNSVQILVASHRPADFTGNESVHIVHAGAALSPPLNFALTDADTEDNISNLNAMYCELTVQYMVLASGQLAFVDKIGFMHYRRFLDFASPLESKFDSLAARLRLIWGRARKLDHLRLKPKSISTACEGAELIVPEPYDVRRAGYKSVREQYVSSSHHFESDWEVCGEVIANTDPALFEEWLNLNSTALLYPGNIYVMSTKLFQDYASALFTILEKVRMRIDCLGRSEQEMRVLGYLGERIFTAFVAMKQREQKIRVSTLPLILIDQL